MCGVANKAASQIWDRIPDTVKNELSSFCGKFQFPGRGQREQPVITFPGALKLAMFLPGEKAKQYRSGMVSIIHRYFAGDPSILREIEANAASDSPIAQMARSSLYTEAGASDLAGHKRLREDLLVSRQVLANVETTTQHMREQNTLARERGEIDKGIMLERGEIDKKIMQERGEIDLGIMRARLDIEKTSRTSELEHAKAMLDIDRAKKALSQPQQQAQTSPVPTGHTTVLKIYHKYKPSFDMIKSCQVKRLLQTAGIKAKAAFEALHGTSPLRIKEGQFDVLCYPEDDEPLILEAIRSAMRDLLGHARPITSFVRGPPASA
jgi:hypothetical protein